MSIGIFELRARLQLLAGVLYGFSTEHTDCPLTSDDGRRLSIAGTELAKLAVPLAQGVQDGGGDLGVPDHEAKMVGARTASVANATRLALERFAREGMEMENSAADARELYWLVSVQLDDVVAVEERLEREAKGVEA